MESANSTAGWRHREMSSGIVERIAARLQFGIEPLQTVLRKQSRLRRLGVAGVDALPRAVIDLEESRDGCGRDCELLIAGHRRYLAKYLFRGEDPIGYAAAWCGTPFLIDLTDHPDFTAYAAQLKRQSKGALVRQINRARRQGFCAEPFDRKDYSEDRYRIDTSKFFRSAGPVLPAALRLGPGRRQGTAAFVCPRHWYTDWGLFDTGRGENHRRLVGYAFLKRIGSVVRVTAFMGHGAHLSDGIMKLLFFDALRWLFDPEDSRVAGIRYIHYGAIEHGGLGLFTWKHRFQFKPFVFSWPPSNEAEPRNGAMLKSGAPDSQLATERA
jgi:hypothetical protein